MILQEDERFPKRCLFLAPPELRPSKLQPSTLSYFDLSRYIAKACSEYTVLYHGGSQPNALATFGSIHFYE